MNGDRLRVVDLNEALARLGGDRKFYRELLDMLLQDAPQQLRDMSEALERADAKRIEQVAHSLKGAAASLEAGPVRDTAQRLETLGREANLSGTIEALHELQGQLERLRQFVQTLE